MESHVKIVGIFHIVFGVFGCIIGLLTFLVMGGASMIVAMNDANAAVPVTILGGLGLLFAFFMTITSIPGIIGGYGLLNRCEWARVLVIILSIIYIPFCIPFGTILGTYSLVVLFSNDVKTSFQTSC